MSLIDVRKTIEKGRDNQELSFGHNKFEMLIRYPNGC